MLRCVCFVVVFLIGESRTHHRLERRGKLAGREAGQELKVEGEGMGPREEVHIEQEGEGPL